MWVNVELGCGAEALMQGATPVAASPCFNPACEMISYPRRARTRYSVRVAVDAEPSNG